MKKLAAGIFALASLLTLPGCPSSSDDPVGDPGETETPTPTPEPGTLGCREITISGGKDGTGAGSSAYITSAIGQNTDTSEFLDAQGWAEGSTLRMCAGALNGGAAPLTLYADVVTAISLPLGNCICREYLAAGTTGTLYCAASSDYADFTYTSDSKGTDAATTPVVIEGPTAVPGEGHARISFSARTAGIDASGEACVPSACTSALSGITPKDVLYSTGTVKSEFTNAQQGGTISVQSVGAPFDDDIADGTGDCEDWVTGAGLGILAGAAEHDEDNPDAGGDVVTVERMAEVPGS